MWASLPSIVGTITSAACCLAQPQPRMQVCHDARLRVCHHDGELHVFVPASTHNGAMDYVRAGFLRGELYFDGLAGSDHRTRNTEFVGLDAVDAFGGDEA